MKYIEGDLFEKISSIDKETVILIPHVTNNVGAWGAGFVIPLAKEFPEARDAFLEEKNPELGVTQFVDARNTIICNMFAQNGVGYSWNNCIPLRYESLKKCMIQVQEKVKELKEEGLKVLIACPMFGSGLAGGDWKIIEDMIETIWGEYETNVYFLKQFIPKDYELTTVDNEIKITYKG